MSETKGQDKFSGNVQSGSRKAEVDDSGNSFFR